jgi:hypothetical protein
LSSRGFEVELVPASRLRRALLAISGGAGLSGTLLVLGLPLRPELVLVLVFLWLVRCLFEIRLQARGASRIDRIRIYPTGSIEGLSRTGTVESLSLLSGSVVVSRVAWLRLGFEDGLQYGELLTGNPCRDEQWRRLQLIWRQHAAAFGGPEGS